MLNVSRLFIVVGLGIVVALIALPFILADRGSGLDAYLEEMAAWHTEWNEAETLDERDRVLDRLNEIRSPVGSDSLEFLDRHRVYQAAHVLFRFAERSAAHAMDSDAVTSIFPEPAPDPGCDELLAHVAINPDALQTPEVRWAHDSCFLLREARNNLVTVRSIARTGWLADHVRALEQ
jgi:hypothetical protein